MFIVIRNSWALLLGMLLFMVGNGLQGTLLGVRGNMEGFSTLELSYVMSGYFVGFLFGSRIAPKMIQRVGHVRVFAALGSLISAALIMFPIVVDPIAWAVLRIIIGFCFSGVYVTAESWLNNASSNETRGQTLSIYLIVQMVGIVTAQYLLLLADPGGFILFILPSVLVSLAFAPILLSVLPAPSFGASKVLTIRKLFKISPTSCVGIFLLGGIFSALFGMSAVYASQQGFKLSHISIFVASIYVGGMVMQYPIGWLSDHMDRRRLAILISVFGVLASLSAMLVSANFWMLVVMMFFIGGVANPLYALLLAYANDYLDYEDMAGASGGLIFINGIGAILGPIVTGQMMDRMGPNGFFLFLAIMLAGIAGYAIYRSSIRETPDSTEHSNYAAFSPSTTAVAVEFAQEAMAEEDQS